MIKNGMDSDNFTTQEGVYLSDRLKRALAASLDKTATIVEAPTGYGKTVAVRELCRNIDLPVVWINIYDEDPYHAWESLCRELFHSQTILQRFLRWPFPTEGMQRTRFADELERLLENGPIVIVLDDFHQIQSDQVSEFFRYLVKEFPNGLHLIIISRKTVFKDEELFVATGKVNRIYTEDLRLSRADFDQYLCMNRTEMEEEYKEQIYERSEGWISMLYVSLLNYKRGGKRDLSTDMEHLVDRVAYAVCSGKTRYFLSYLALLPDFTKKQADFFNGGEDSSDMLQELLNNHSFFDIDPATGKYHFHTILRNCIFHHFERLSLSERCIRYERLAEYLVQEGRYQEALKWYEKAGNYEGVLRTLELFETICSRTEDRELMIRCYDDCPKGLFEDYPLSLVLFMWRFYNYGDDKRLAECRRLFEHLIGQIKLAKEDKDYLWKVYDMFLSQSAYNDLDQMKYYMEKAQAYPAGDMPRLDADVPRTFGIPSLFHMFYTGGSGSELVERMKMQLADYRVQGMSAYGGLECLAEAEWLYNIGDFEKAQLLCHKAARGCQKDGQICYMINIQYLNAHLAYMRGEFDEARRILDDMRALVVREQSESASLVYTVDMCEAFFYEYIGYPKQIADWLQRGGKMPAEVMPQAYPYAAMIRMVVALQQGQYAILLSAREEVLDFLKKYPNRFTIGNIYLIFAAAAAGLAKIAEAKADIRRAAELVGTEPVMLYAKYGEWLVAPLQELSGENEDYQQIICACRRFSSIHKSAVKKEYTGIFPMLTKRENDIALLAVDGFTNRQIAAQLFISENTVKSSMKHIFTKLGISSRRELLRIAQLGTCF